MTLRFSGSMTSRASTLQQRKMLTVCIAHRGGEGSAPYACDLLRRTCKCHNCQSQLKLPCRRDILRAKKAASDKVPPRRKISQIGKLPFRRVPCWSTAAGEVSLPEAIDDAVNGFGFVPADTVHLHGACHVHELARHRLHSIGQGPVRISSASTSPACLRPLAWVPVADGGIMLLLSP